MTPQPLSSSQLQTVLLEAKSKNRLLLTRSEQEICPSEPVVPGHQRFIKLEDPKQGFLSESLQRRRPPANRIQLLLEPTSRKRPRETGFPEPPQPSDLQSHGEDQVLLPSNNKKRCTETQDNQPDDPSSSDTRPDAQPHPAGRTDVVDISSNPTVKKDEPSTSPQARPTACPSPGINYMELDQGSSKGDSPNEITRNEERALAFDDHRLPTYGPSIKIELPGVDAQILKEEGGFTQELEEQQGQELGAKEPDPRQVLSDEEMKPAFDEQLEETERYEGVHSIPMPRDSPEWPVFEPDEPFQHHGAIVPSSPPAPTEISNLQLLLEVPDSPMRLFEASSPSRPLWEDDLPSVEPVADDHSQAIKALFGSDTMNPAHLNQRPVRRALISKPPGREHPLYKGTREPDGLYHCPWEKEVSCNHKPAKLKCTFDKFIDSHLKPYKCRVPGCQSTSFSSTACLFRHEREAHALHGYGDKPFICPQEGCERATPGNGFPRRWNLVDHMRRRHKLNAPISGIIDARTSIKMADKKETKEKSPMQQETEDDLKDRWESHRLVFESLMEKLNDPENPDNAVMTEEAQMHLSSLLKIQTKLDEKRKNDDEMGQEKTKEKGKEKAKEESKGDDTEGKYAEGGEK
ncbi:hypothetical protein LCI18_011322 [Fusarium solani-melongenae]|uniref:Uncharacterized protein n=1 Tax=Fusarium solani subsp. cucurbitae TaxID=2747967 RepID=A0ACD3ZH20_FUSSC|nr:hypothetical protein LCI18_011322 [Fusarium solani-melongenae]